jgi:hypothetical protein
LRVHREIPFVRYKMRNNQAIRGVRQDFNCVEAPLEEEMFISSSCAQKCYDRFQGSAPPQRGFFF